MRLKFIQLEIQWSNQVTVFDLRELIKGNLKKYGDPLRWSITASKESLLNDCFRSLTVEAIVILENEESM